MLEKKPTSLGIDFVYRLKELISCLGMSYIEFANTIGITDSYLSMILAGKRNPSVDLVVGVFMRYKKYYNWLLTGEGALIDIYKDDIVLQMGENNNKVVTEKPNISPSNQMVIEMLASNHILVQIGRAHV